jgi:hypothetical protein
MFDPGKTPSCPACAAEKQKRTTGPVAVVRGGVTSSSAPLGRFFDGKPRQRLIVGAVLALLVGFVPAHLYASMAESGYAEIRRDFERQPPPVTQAEYAQARQTHAQVVKQLESKRGQIRAITGGIWVVLAAGLAFAWFRFLT